MLCVLCAKARLRPSEICQAHRMIKSCDDDNMKYTYNINLLLLFSSHMYVRMKMNTILLYLCHVHLYAEITYVMHLYIYITY